MAGNGDRLRILAYHAIQDRDLFRRHMFHLSTHYQLIGCEDVIRYVRGGSLPRRACWVTFDDADPSVVELGLEVLEEFSIPAAMFVCPAVVDTRKPLWWQVIEAAAHLGLTHDGRAVSSELIGTLKKVPDTQRRLVIQALERGLADRLGRPYEYRQISSSALRDWTSSGRSIGNHTWDHPLLDRCDPSEQRLQIERAHEALAALQGFDPMAFSYPNGNVTRQAQLTLTSLGYDLGVLFDHRLAGRDNPLTLSRIRVNSHDTMVEFAAKVSGVHPRIHAIRRVGRQYGMATRTKTSALDGSR